MERIHRVEIVTFHGPGAYTKDKKWEALLARYFVDQCGWPVRKFASLPFHEDKRHRICVKICGEKILWAVVFSPGKKMTVYAYEPRCNRTLQEFIPRGTEHVVNDYQWLAQPPPKLTPLAELMLEID